MSGLFGEIDATEVPDDPFYVAPDTYQCVLTEAGRAVSKDGEKHAIAFKWVIEDEDSDFYGQNISDWNNIFPGITSDEVTADIKKSMSRTKQRLTQMGFTPDEMNNMLDNEEILTDKIGMVAYVEVFESKDKNDPDKRYTNIRSVRPIGEE